MTRRSWLTTLFALPATACCSELRRYHSSVKFDVSTAQPAVGEPITITFDYLDEEPAGTWSMVLVSGATGAVVDEASVTDSSSRVTLTATEPGPHTVQCRRNGQNTAHRVIDVH